VSISALAQRKSCECTGQSNATVYSGGDSNPLTLFTGEIGNTGEPITIRFTATRETSTHSVRDVTDVLWEVAGTTFSLACEKTNMRRHRNPSHLRSRIRRARSITELARVLPSTVYEPSGGCPQEADSLCRTEALDLLWNPQFRSQLTMGIYSRFQSSVQR